MNSNLIVDAWERYIHELKSMTMHKLAVILCVSGIFLVIQKFVETYLFHDWSYLSSLFILIAIDTITGAIKAIKEHVFSSRQFGRFIAKIILYCLLLIAVNVLISFKIDGHASNIFGWIELFMFNALMFREAVSIFENIALIYPSLIPQYVMKRIQQFDASGLEIKEEDKTNKDKK